MGKRSRKTRWRKLPIGEADQCGGAEGRGELRDADDSNRITFNEDEYTKITTPRQDVLFKKGYLGRKRQTNTCEYSEAAQNCDSVESEQYLSEEAQYVYMPGANGFMDQMGQFYFVGNSNNYEVYDPYTGNLTVIVGPAPQYGQPLLTAVPCQPVPLQQLEWFNPPAPWSCPYSSKKTYSTDSQNCSVQSSESTGTPGSPQEALDEAAGPVYHSPYVYPGYMFGAPLYNVNGVSVQGVNPVGATQPSCDLSTLKRRKKKRRRKTGRVTDEGSESSCEDALSCEVRQSAESQSGASSDTCSKTNSDSGINTGTNTPPLHADCIDQCKAGTMLLPVDIGGVIAHADLNMLTLTNNGDTNLQSKEETTPGENELTHSTQEYENAALKNHSPVTVQENSPCLLCFSPVNSSDGESDRAVLLVSSQPQVKLDCSTTNSLNSSFIPEDESLTAGVEFSECLDTEDFSSETLQDLSCCSDLQYEDINVSHHFELDKMHVTHKNPNFSEKYNENSKPIGKIDGNLENCTNSVHDLHLENTVTESNKILNNGSKSFIEPDLLNELCITVVDDRVELEAEAVIVVEPKESHQLGQAKEVIVEVLELSNKMPSGLPVISPDIITKEVVKPVNTFEALPAIVWISPSLERVRPVPPPRKKRHLCQAASKVATSLSVKIVSEAVREAANESCRLALPITEAVTQWLQSQRNTVRLSCGEPDEDEAIKDEELISSKNVSGNPFPAPSASGSGTRVAEDFDRRSMVSSGGEWDLWDSNTRSICDPTRSVDKYYRLAADSPDQPATATSPSVLKTAAVHIHRRAGPFPCGVCCIIQ